MWANGCSTYHFSRPTYQGRFETGSQRVQSVFPYLPNFPFRGRPAQEAAMRNLVVPGNSLKKLEEAIQAVGTSLRYLPKYSPDLNPIELVFHPLKTFLRKAAQRTIEGLNRYVGSDIRTLNPSEAMCYFKHYGYAPL